MPTDKHISCNTRVEFHSGSDAALIASSAAYIAAMAHVEDIMGGNDAIDPPPEQESAMRRAYDLRRQLQAMPATTLPAIKAKAAAVAASFTKLADGRPDPLENMLAWSLVQEMLALA